MSDVLNPVSEHDGRDIPSSCSEAASYVVHLKSLVGIQEAANMEDLNTDEWRHMPETDQIVGVDPMDIVISASRKGRNKKAPRDGVQKCRRPPAYKVHFIPPLTPGVGWEGVRWDGGSSGDNCS